MLHRISRSLLGIGNTKRKLLLMALDSALLVLAVAAAYWLRTNVWYLPNNAILLTYPLAPLTALPVFLMFSLYRYSIRYLGNNAIWQMLLAVSLSTLLWSLAIALLQIEAVPRSVYIIYWLLALVGIVGLRYLGRWLASSDDDETLSHRQKRTLIYGAGSAGRLALQALVNSEYKVIAFVDDDAKRQGRIIDSYTVYRADGLQQLVSKLKIDSVLLAMPSISGNRRREIISSIEALSLEIRSLPSLGDLASGKLSLSNIRPVDITDLLGREPVPPIAELLSAQVHERRVLVSGAGGSIGAELARQIVAAQPSQLILVDFNEYGLYRCTQELQAQSDNLTSCLGDLTNANWVNELIAEQQPDTVFHAAAYKHVPLLESNAINGFRNNVLSSYNLSAACAQHQVSNFTLVSSDKAVNPQSVMGLSKRYAELLTLSLQQQYPKSIFSVVRFGNVLNSSGSVIPLFRQQIAAGGPLTVTDKNMTRYFMTISEAASLVIQAGAMASAGDIFVLDMGKPVSIYDLAVKMLHLSGLSVYNPKTKLGDIAIELTGIRPGEKLHEVLSYSDNFSATRHAKILKVEEQPELFADVAGQLAQIQADLAAGKLPAY